MLPSSTDMYGPTCYHLVLICMDLHYRLPSSTDMYGPTLQATHLVLICMDLHYRLLI